VIVDIMLAHELIPASNLIIAVVRRVDIVDACVLSACSAVGLQEKVTTHRDKTTQHKQHRQHCTIGIIYLVFFSSMASGTQITICFCNFMFYIAVLTFHFHSSHQSIFGLF